MLYHHEAGRWEPENEKEAEEYDAYMEETMGGRLLSEEQLRAIEERWKADPTVLSPTPWTHDGRNILDANGASLFATTAFTLLGDFVAVCCAPDDVRSLVAALREERAESAQLRAELERLSDERAYYRSRTPEHQRLVSLNDLLEEGNP